ncbi:MAG: pentapeptide repeat-containing protein [Cyanobacteriota bacterium]|nr:pentapeptide repeat-containing protein [Cyanobacteriota bacterium]
MPIPQEFKVKIKYFFVSGVIMDDGRELITRRKLLKRYAAGERDFAGMRISSSGLDGEDLQEIDLNEADLIGVNLTTTNLSGADLSGAKMHCVNLTNANLSYGNLQGVDLSGANCTGADFSNCNLVDAIFTAANFDGANLYRTAIGGDAKLIKTDFTGAKNFPGIGEGVLVYKTFWEDGSFFEGPDWYE